MLSRLTFERRNVAYSQIFLQKGQSIDGILLTLNTVNRPFVWKNVKKIIKKKAHSNALKISAESLVISCFFCTEQPRTKRDSIL